MAPASDIIGLKARSLRGLPACGGRPDAVLCTANGILPEFNSAARRCRRRCGGAAARSDQYDEGRLAKPLAKPDAVACAVAVRRDRHHHARGLGDGPLKQRGTMVVLNRIYTRTGDDGTTALGSGERRPKYDSRVAAYGTVDETNAAIGVVRLHLAEARELDAMLGLIQNDLFDLGADLAVPQRDGKAERLRMLSSQVERLERDIDRLNEKLSPLTSFVLPGGTPAAAHLHLARTICRRAERMMVELAARPNEPVSDAAIQYM